MVLLNIPAHVAIVLCYLWIGLNETAAITAVALNKTAMDAVSIREGVQALDPKLG
ncbi:putative ABC transporter protein [Rhodobacterales bacterium HTCC2150]|nr:putative ABC transporter protein [Rhodobacterales bacterium HTCC2150] [Rhodobacteraceae bacterium HTCC2150]